MTGNRTSEKTREKILQAALAEFLDNGFDKARVDDIARRAGLTKMMLYYHFSSKENMMSELMARVLNEVKEKFQENLSNVDADDPQSVRRHVETMLDYFYDKKDIIRLIVSENLKSKGDSTAPFSILEELFGIISSTFADDPKKASQYQFLVKVFFFNSLPMVLYSSLSDKFNRDFGIDPERSRQVFIDTFLGVFYGNLDR